MNEVRDLWLLSAGHRPNFALGPALPIAPE